MKTRGEEVRIGEAGDEEVRSGGRKVLWKNNDCRGGEREVRRRSEEGELVQTARVSDFVDARMADWYSMIEEEEHQKEVEEVEVVERGIEMEEKKSDEEKANTVKEEKLKKVEVLWRGQVDRQVVNVLGKGEHVGVVDGGVLAGGLRVVRRSVHHVTVVVPGVAMWKLIYMVRKQRGAAWEAIRYNVF